MLAILFINSFDGVKHILSHIFISIFLKDVSWQRLLIVLNNMNEVTKFSTWATDGSMVILAWNCSVISNGDYRLLAWSLWLVRNLLLFQQCVVGFLKLINHWLNTLDVVLVFEFQLNHWHVFKLITLKRNLIFD